MDLHFIPNATATADERDAVDAAIAAVPAALRGLRRRHLLLPALHAVQKRIGWISGGAVNHIAARLDVAPAEIYGVASFYALFSLEPRPTTVVHVCDDLACRMAGAESLCAALEKALGPAGQPAAEAALAQGERQESKEATWLRSPCLGQCDRAPAAFFQFAGTDREDASAGFATPAAILATLAGTAPAGAGATPAPPAGTGATSVGAGVNRPGDAAADGERSRSHGTRLLRRVGVVDPASLDDYRAHGGYAALRRALALGPEQVIREITDSGLVGRGGAAFPAGRKWDAVARAPVRPHYLVANADESEPGTFKDRVLMEGDPFALVEAMTIAGIATGCELGFIYIRVEYPLATARLAHAVAQARARGLLGEDILGHGARFEIEIRRGAGAYICGEETAIFNSIEGRRGEPRNKPPFPVQAGVFGKPTLVNNVESLVNVLDIVTEGAAWFASNGTAGSTGTKLFSVSGCVRHPGVYEVPFGVTLFDLVARAGGVPDGRALQAVLLGGAAGTFAGPDELGVPLTLEDARAAGLTLGSGVVMVFDDTVDLRDTVLRIAAFFRDESCGQCVPCRVGTVRQEEALHRLASGRTLGSAADEVALVDDVARAMCDASICGLGQTASGAVQSALKKFALFGK